MFRKVWTTVLVWFTAFGSLATAGEPLATGGTNQITNSIGMKLTLIPSGEFMMGSAESAEDTAAFFDKYFNTDYLTADFFKEEHPQHRVRITKPFYLGTYPVTRAQFRQFVKDTGYLTGAEKGEKLPAGALQPGEKHKVFKQEKPGADGWDAEKKDMVFDRKFSWQNTGFEQTDEHPVVNVTWNDAVAFCKWLTRKDGKTFRLPTEAEWEYACRAGTTTRYHSGDDPETLATVANVADAKLKASLPGLTLTTRTSDGYLFTSPVGSFKPNAFGLFDMHGNAWQWCADRYGDRYYTQSPPDDPTGPTGPTGSDPDFVHVLRGGSWLDSPISARSARRCNHVSIERTAAIGFRVAMTK
jgi:formylglycine-generating enzyme